MGYTQAQGMADAVHSGDLGLEQAVDYHLRVNHYPPIHPIFIPVVLEAIRLARDGEWDEELDLPNRRQITVRHAVIELHLEPFVERGE